MGFETILCCSSGLTQTLPGLCVAERQVLRCQMWGCPSSAWLSYQTPYPPALVALSVSRM